MAHITDNLRIALVHETLTVPGGAEKVLLELHHLFPTAPIFTSLYKPENFPELAQATVVTAGLNRWSFCRNHHQLMIPLLPYAFEQFGLSDYDVVISSSTAAAKGVITRPETLHICYCHTPMRWAWTPYLDPRASSSLIRRVAAHYLRLWDVASVNRVDAWIANSQTVANRIRKFYGREATVIFPPVILAKHKAAAGDAGYFLSVNRLVAQKRIDIIVQAAKEGGFPLKIAGSGPEEAHLKQLAKGAKNIEFLGYVSDQKRDELFAGCKAFLYATEEDFGIVPIEAMSYGKPVIAYNKGGASETVKDKVTGLHFERQTPEAIIQAVQRFETMPFDAAKIAEATHQFADTRFRSEMMDYISNHLRTHALKLNSRQSAEVN